MTLNLPDVLDVYCILHPMTVSRIKVLDPVRFAKNVLVGFMSISCVTL